jgi:hypothetical protein
MSSLSQNCKIDSDCQIVIPIDDRANIGHTLTAISLNFENIDISLCNLSTSALEFWSPASLEFFEKLPAWNDMLNVIQTFSSCWNDSYNTVATLSSFWLKPITLIYPYPFTGGTTGIDITVQSWLNENFPPRVGNCFNFIVGQELYVFTPQYSQINRITTATSNQDNTLAIEPTVRVTNGGGIGFRLNRKVPFQVLPDNSTTVTFIGSYYCISRTTPFSVKVNFKVDSSIKITVPDKFIETIVGLKFKINPTSYAWEFAEFMFNIT